MYACDFGFNWIGYFCDEFVGHGLLPVSHKFPIVDTNANNAVFQGEASLSPDGSIVIIVDKSGGIVELLDAENLSFKSLTYGPDKVESVIDVTESARALVSNSRRYILYWQGSARQTAAFL